MCRMATLWEWWREHRCLLDRQISCGCTWSSRRPRAQRSCARHLRKKRDNFSRGSMPDKRFLLLLIFCAQLCGAVTRHYYITAEDVPWDYAPSHRDLIHGAPLPKDWVNDTKYNKTRFFEYTDNTFKTRKPQPDWLGIL